MRFYWGVRLPVIVKEVTEHGEEDAPKEDRTHEEVPPPARLLATLLLVMVIRHLSSPFDPLDTQRPVVGRRTFSCSFTPV
jgi:hypothetical protein